LARWQPCQSQNDGSARRKPPPGCATWKSKVARGYTLLTWNGLGFRLGYSLAEEVRGMLPQCRALALGPCGHDVSTSSCALGHGVGFGRLPPKGMKLAGKLEGILGVSCAPVLWAEGGEKRFWRMLSPRTCWTMIELALKCETPWGASVGRLGAVGYGPWRCLGGWLSVSEALNCRCPILPGWPRLGPRRGSWGGWGRRSGHDSIYGEVEMVRDTAFLTVLGWSFLRAWAIPKMAGDGINSATRRRWSFREKERYLDMKDFFGRSRGRLGVRNVYGGPFCNGNSRFAAPN